VKVTGSGKLLGGTAEDGVHEGLGGLMAAGAGSRDTVVPGGVCAEVALPRSHLVQPARRELVEAHERMG